MLGAETVLVSSRVKVFSKEGLDAGFEDLDRRGENADRAIRGG